jgi:hypothetical protein
MQSRSKMSWLRVLSLAVLVMIAIAARAPAAHAQNTVGTITQITGAATIQRPGATIGAAQNMPIMLHDRITTEASGSLTIGLVDNSSMQLGPSSTITIDESVLVNGVGAPSKVGLVSGKLHSTIVGAMRSSTTAFEVHTPNAIGAVRGTEYDTSTDTTPREGSKDCFQNTDLDVEDGTVQFCNTANPPECKDIHKGEHSEIRCGAFFAGGGVAGVAGLGTLGAVVGGVAIATGAGLGAAAGAGAIGGGNNNPPPKKKKSHKD